MGAREIEIFIATLIVHENVKWEKDSKEHNVLIFIANPVSLCKTIFKLK